MNLLYMLILIIIKDINCYKSKHLTNSPDQVIPARYKIASKTNHDPVATQNFPSDFFPQVEYPESIMDSSKPFYISSSPFPDEVKTLFKSLSQGNNKAKLPIDYSWIHNQKRNEKNEEKQSLTSNKVGVNELTVTKGNKIDSNNKDTNGMIHKETLILDFEDDIAHYQKVDKDMGKLLKNMSFADVRKPTDDAEMDYVIGFINDLDELMKNFTSIAEFAGKGLNTTLNLNESECPAEFTSVISSVSPYNNDAIIEFNGNSSSIEKHGELVLNPLFKEPDTNESSINFTATFFDEDIRKTTFVDDFCSFGTIANKTDGFCTEN